MKRLQAHIEASNLWNRLLTRGSDCCVLPSDIPKL